MSARVTPSLDPRYATGACLHGASGLDKEPEIVAVVTTEADAARLIDERSEARAVKRALRKSVTGQDLSANEQRALAKHMASR